MQKGKVIIGWVNCRDRLRTTKCYRCHQFGHQEKDCKSEVDRSKECFRCGKEAHKAGDCDTNKKRVSAELGTASMYEKRKWTSVLSASSTGMLGEQTGYGIPPARQQSGYVGVSTSPARWLSPTPVSPRWRWQVYEYTVLPPTLRHHRRVCEIPGCNSHQCDIISTASDNCGGF